MAAIVGFKTKLLVNDGSGQAFAKVDHSVQVTLPERMIETVEVTALDEADNYKRYVPSPLVDGGTLKVQVYFTSANLDRFTALLGKQFQTPTVKTKWQCQPPDSDASGPLLAKQVEFEGFVTKLGETTFSKSTDAVVFDVEVKVNSAWTVTNQPNPAP